MSDCSIQTSAPSPTLLARLAAVGTPTLSSQLIKNGLRRSFLTGPRRLVGDGAICGPAFTLRFVPERDDKAVPASYGWPGALPAAIDAAPAGSVVVIDARGHQGAGTVGDIFADRLRIQDVQGIVSDGVVRDLPGLRQVGLPIWASGTASPPSIGGLSFAGWGEPIGCGDAAIWPGDLIVADEDGVLVVPRHLAEEIAIAGEKQNRFEAWVQRRVASGAQLVGLYPADAATLAEFEMEETSLHRSQSVARPSNPHEGS
jgi:regulator of RNase E activity RraA